MPSFAESPLLAALPGGLNAGETSNLLRICKESEPQEACGVVVEWHGENYVIGIPNVAEDPLGHVEADPAHVMQVVEKYGMGNILATWHSHPPRAIAGAELSAYDVAHAVPGILSGVVYAGEVRWYSVSVAEENA